MWLRAESDTALTVQGSEALSIDALWAGLDRFHQITMHLLSARIGSASLAEAERLRTRSQLERLRSGGIVDRLAGIIDRRAANPTLHRPGASTVVAACRLVGHALGIDIEPPANMTIDQWRCRRGLPNRAGLAGSCPPRAAARRLVDQQRRTAGRLPSRRSACDRDPAGTAQSLCRGRAGHGLAACAHARVGGRTRARGRDILPNARRRARSAAATCCDLLPRW